MDVESAFLDGKLPFLFNSARTDNIVVENTIDISRLM